MPPRRGTAAGGNGYTALHRRRPRRISAAGAPRRTSARGREAVRVSNGTPASHPALPRAHFASEPPRRAGTTGLPPRFARATPRRTAGATDAVRTRGPRRAIIVPGAPSVEATTLTLVRDHHNRPQYFVSVIEDVTEKIRAEQALKDSERRLELALGAAGIGFWERDLRTGVTTISGEYLRLHALTLNHPRLTHEEWLKLVHPDDRNRVDEEYRQSLERTHYWDTEFRLLWPDGSVH